jgi:NAD(P)H-hydrate epimerase
MKIFSRDQIALVDKLTIEMEPISEIDLMERASVALTQWIQIHYPDARHIAVVAGSGNNGGDALAVARLLCGPKCSVHVFLPEQGRPRSRSAQTNLDRLQDFESVRIFSPEDGSELPDLRGYSVLLDGLYGSGLNRPLKGFDAEVVEWINRSGIEVVSIDLPSGLFCDENLYNDGPVVKATTTLTLEFPKLALFFAENSMFFGRWVVIPIGLSRKAIADTQSDLFFVNQQDVKILLKPRKTFAHKGSYGHGLLIAGSSGKFGAAQLATRGALRAGTGLLTTHIPRSGSQMLQISVPESMTSVDPDPDFVTICPELAKYQAVAAGPGLGKEKATLAVIRNLISQSTVPLVLDADALNILAENPVMIKELPYETILTPHPAEFDRLSGIVLKREEERFVLAREFSRSYGVVLVLKGAFTRIFFPDGKVYFNSTGNPGMATGGCGDVLTGILLGLLCQGYSPLEAAVLGVFLHGRAGDLWVEQYSEESLLAGDLADSLGLAFRSLKSK